MAVTADQVEHGERDMQVRTRTSAKSTAAPALGADEQLAALRQRIRAGTNKVVIPADDPKTKDPDDPKPKDAPACRECFQRGWIAAMQSLQKE